MLRSVIHLGAARILILLLLAVAVPNPGRAQVTITLLEVGDDVVGTGSGTLNLTALTLLDASFGHLGDIIEPSSALLAMGRDETLRKYSGISGPQSWGLHITTPSIIGSGDPLVIAGIDPQFLYVPQTYVSGDPLSSSVTFRNTTLAGLGFVRGTYTYTWGIGPTASSLTVTSVPESANWTLTSASY
jgi:hypothetical protein